MKRLVSMFGLAILLTSCGAINDKCGSDLRMGCNTIFGELPEDNTEKFDQIDQKLAEHDRAISVLRERDEFFSTKIDTLEEKDTTLSDRITESVDNFNDTVRIMEIKKPCTNAKEVLLILSDNTVMAYFESGTHKYLSTILDGTNYATTDGTGCNFSISGTGSNVTVTGSN